MAVDEEIIGAALGRKCKKVHSYGKLVARVCLAGCAI